MPLGLGDRQEEENIRKEAKLSDEMYAQITTLHEESEDLQKEYKKLLKVGKQLRNIIRCKEKENEEELNTMVKMQEHLKEQSVDTLRKKAARVKSREQDESTLSKEEATILQGMLNQLKKTYQHGEDVIKLDKQLYEMMREIYHKDLDDYKLEVKDIKQA